MRQEGKLIKRTEVEVRVGKLKNGKDTTRGVAGGMGGGLDLEVCNIAFANGVALEDWRSTVIVPLYKGKGEEGMYQKIYARILVDGL